MRAADRSGATWVVIMNAEEARRRVVQLRNLASGDQREVAWDALPEAITSPQGPDEIARSGGVKREGPE
jgi:histidyl-tRNA synthetase